MSHLDSHDDTDAVGTVLVAPVLVRDYRRLLRLFPYTYRRAHEAEMLGHLVDAAQPGQSRPTRAERRDLLRAAAREWLLAPLGPTERQRASASVVVLVVLTAVLAAPAAYDLVRAVEAVTNDSAREVLGSLSSPVLLATVAALVAVPLAPAWLAWLAALVAVAVGARRTGLVLAALAATAGVVAVGSLVAAERAFVAFQAVGWVVVLLAFLLALAARVRQTAPVFGARAGAVAFWMTAATLALSARRGASVVSQEHVWVSPSVFFSFNAVVVLWLSAVALLVLVRPVRQAVPVLGGALLATTLSRSDVFWSGALDTTAVNLGNVLGVVGLSAALTLATRWVVNRLDELAASRAAHRALLATSSAADGTAAAA
ncbi:hypothetical protein NSA53_08630 [Cellulosimicrobium cellulans]|uniref:hypothetical protein n=1 Tax=Cellulosimicrobium cellulans TaxID=1710 RepID=UPI00214A5C1B|nr:hypothetical protein [Cellulosimicrobium cellulans]